MKTTTATPSPLAPPYVSHVPGESAPRLERGPDQSYNGPAIRVDLAGYGGAFHLGWEGNTMAERPDDYAAHLIACCNSAPALTEARELLEQMRDFWQNGTPIHPGSHLAEEAEALIKRLAEVTP